MKIRHRTHSGSAARELPLVLVPELFRQTGGVQRYSLRFIEALDRIYGEKVPVVSMNDRPQDFPSGFLPGRKVSGCGEGGMIPRKLRLMARTLFTPRLQPIFSTHPGPAPWLALLKVLFRKPFLCVTHGIDAWSISAVLAKSIEQSDLVLPVSQYTKSRLAGQLGTKKPPFSVLSNMVDGNRFFPDAPSVNWRRRLSISPEARVMLTVCRLSSTEKGKGYDLILDSLPTLVKADPSLVWILAGKGDDLARLQQKAVDCGVSDHCRFPGFIDDSELPDLYRSSDLFVLPSSKEGFGIVFLEAIASGLPAIAGNRDGSVDALANGELGHLINPENGTELIEAIETCLKAQSHDPLSLHHACIKRFGKAAFENRLHEILTQHPKLEGNRQLDPAPAPSR